MADIQKETTQEASFSSDSDSSCCGCECCSNVDELHICEHKITEELLIVPHYPASEVSKCATDRIQANKALVSLVVKSSENIQNIGCFDQDRRSAMKSKNEDSAVMSLSDLDQYDIMLRGLIDELSTLSEKIVSHM